METKTRALPEAAEPTEADPARELLVYMRLADQEQAFNAPLPRSTGPVQTDEAVNRVTAPAPQRREHARFNLD